MQMLDAESVRWRASNTLLSDEQLGRSVQVDAAQPRMTRLWARLAAGKPIKLGVIGASVAMEGGCQSQYQTQRCAAGRVQPMRSHQHAAHPRAAHPRAPPRATRVRCVDFDGMHTAVRRPFQVSQSLPTPSTGHLSS